MFCIVHLRLTLSDVTITATHDTKFSDFINKQTKLYYKINSGL